MSEQRCLAVAACVLVLLAGALSAAARAQPAPPPALSDPMQPAGLQAQSPVAGSPEQAPVAELRVQAIKREGRRHSAVINGQVARVGDDVGGAQITAISASSVTIDVGGKSSVLKLLGQDIKHDARPTH